ncbi:MAG: metallo-beta-lactamase family protein [Candidatus Peregrinibacteria bacterium Greene0416_19]|nr:MAG: metallo-beta-lactamase family protein [Candidatus Peregrinibacteria bacterium Greene0416_19]
MSRSPSWRWPFVFALLAAGALLWKETQARADGTLRSYPLDARHGEATLIVGPKGETVLVDGGSDWGALELLGEHLSPFNRSLDLVVLTSPTGNHMGSLPEVIRRYDVGAVLMSGIEYDSAAYREFLHEVDQRKIPVILAVAGRSIDLGGGIVIEVTLPAISAAGVRATAGTLKRYALRLEVMPNPKIIPPGERPSTGAGAGHD